MPFVWAWIRLEMHDQPAVSSSSTPFFTAGLFLLLATARDPPARRLHDLATFESSSSRQMPSPRVAWMCGSMATTATRQVSWQLSFRAMLDRLRESPDRGGGPSEDPGAEGGGTDDYR